MSNWIVNILVIFLDIFGLFLTEKKVYRLSGYWRVFLLWLHLLFLSDTTVTETQMKCNWHPHCSHTGWLCADVSHKHTHSLTRYSLNFRMLMLWLQVSRLMDNCWGEDPGSLHEPAASFTQMSERWAALITLPVHSWEEWCWQETQSHQRVVRYMQKFKVQSGDVWCWS